MKIFLSPEFTKKKENLPRKLDDRLTFFIGTLKEMSPDEFKLQGRVKQLMGLDPPLYIFNFDSYRIFASIVNEVGSGGVLLLDLQEKTSTAPHVRYLQGDDLFWEVDALVADTIHELADDDLVSGLIAETNACGWYVDDYHIEEVMKNDDGTISGTVFFHISGDQDEDRVYHGTEIDGEAALTIAQDGEVKYEVNTADIRRDYDES